LYPDERVDGYTDCSWTHMMPIPHAIWSTTCVTHQGGHLTGIGALVPSVPDRVPQQRRRERVRPCGPASAHTLAAPTRRLNIRRPARDGTRRGVGAWSLGGASQCTLRARLGVGGSIKGHQRGRRWDRREGAIVGRGCVTEWGTRTNAEWGTGRRRVRGLRVAHTLRHSYDVDGALRTS
jgi:hypothetical protein